MISGDYFAIGILFVFCMLGLFRCFNWIFRAGLGLAVGCVVLVVLTCLPAMPVVTPIAQALGSGEIASALTDGADGLLGAFGLQLTRPAPATMPSSTRDGSRRMRQAQGSAPDKDHGSDCRQQDLPRFGRLDSFRGKSPGQRTSQAVRSLRYDKPGVRY